MARSNGWHALALVALPLMMLIGPAQAQQLPPDRLTLDWCLDRAREANPSLATALAAADAARHRIEHAGALEDPRIAYDASNVPVGDLDFDSTPLSGHQLGLRQKLPYPGLLSRREAAARSASEASRLLAEDQGLGVDRAVETAWSELAFSERALDITNRNIELLRNLTATAESRYRVGSGLQQDVLRAQVELTALLQEKLRREEAIERATAALVRVLDLPPATQLPRTDTLRMDESAPPLAASLETLDARSARLETGLVPQARQSLEASRSAYEVGRIEFLSLLDSQVRLLQAELRLARARADKRIAFAALEAVTGEKLR